MAENRLLADALVIRELEEELQRLSTTQPRPQQARAWLQRLRDLLERGEAHDRALARVREQVYLQQVLAGILVEGEGQEPQWQKAPVEDRWKYQTYEQMRVQRAELEAGAEKLQLRLEILAETVHDPAWRTAIAAITASDLYGGLTLTPQTGLIPLGPDPDSGLWEFWHVESGARPERNAETGRFETGNRFMGMVFVLLPGGTFWMGGQSDDVRSRNFDPYVPGEWLTAPLQVTLQPFFLSKYELSLQQWEICRHAVDEPGQRHAPGGLRWAWRGIAVSLQECYPLQSEPWVELVDGLRAVGLTLPTEAQWEYGCRGGTTTPWWTGADWKSIYRGDHVRREPLVAIVGKERSRQFAPLVLGPAKLPWSAGSVIIDNPRWAEEDDRYLESREHHRKLDASEAPLAIGSLAPNPFGLHDLHGNVSEWCLDEADHPWRWRPTPRPGDGLRSPPRDRDQPIRRVSPDRIIRGGSWQSLPEEATSTVRDDANETVQRLDVGARPARAITRD